MIEHNGISLRRTQVDDLDYVVAAEQAEENRDYVAQQTVAEHQALLADTDVLHLIVELESQPVGYVIMAGLLKASRSIELRRIVVTQKGMGLGRRAIKLCKDLAFNHLNAHRLWLDVVQYNTRAQGLYLSEGFVQEGILRECDLYRGQFESLVIMSILEQEYKSTC